MMASNVTGIIDALRTRQLELGLTSAELEHRAGLTAGHVDKVLGPSRTKNIGAVTLEALMEALAVDFDIVGNPEKLARLVADNGPTKRSRGSWSNHRVSRAAVRHVMIGLSKRAVAAKLASGMQGTIAQKGGLARAAKLTASRRREIACKAAQARWGAQPMGA
jgi:hypothetical protein